MDFNLFFEKQLAVWEQARDNYEALSRVRYRTINIDGIEYTVQYNPGRERSSSAKVDSASISSRRCFLCDNNLPPEQIKCDFLSRYHILINPYPIFPIHFTIPCKTHTSQSMEGRLDDFLILAKEMEGFVVFYNGARCGASAPDHLHFQAGNTRFLPIERDYLYMSTAHSILMGQETTLALMKDKLRGTFMISSSSASGVATTFEKLLESFKQSSLYVNPGEEPMMNIIAFYKDNRYTLFVFFRRAHRPSCYYQSDNPMLISPGAVDMGGVFVMPKAKDFDRIDANILRSVLSEVCYSQAELVPIMRCLWHNQEPLVKVGILENKHATIDFITPYQYNKSLNVNGSIELEAEGNRILWKGGMYDELYFKAPTIDSVFQINDVVIGIDFHWERKENQRFHGDLKVIVHDGKLVLINILRVEEYLKSVISSEMSATSSYELLKAHAVISRSWLLAQIEQSSPAHNHNSIQKNDADEVMMWFDREDHELFDVCADDHCQRYQGITRKTSPLVEQAVKETAGQVLTYEGVLCDARFSKCCGGIMEEFDTCWGDIHYPYLKRKADVALQPDSLPDLTLEVNAEHWIRTSPEAFCNTNDRNILTQVLNNYDQETTDFYRWKVTYSRRELSELLRNRSGIDFGDIIDLIPVKRGPSGRMSMLRIKGTLRDMTVGKELIIRKWLSRTHLYSSAFVVDKECDSVGDPATFIITGAGWGHGVGLCQIGAAVMAHEGYDYLSILKHYYIQAEITLRY